MTIGEVVEHLIVIKKWNQLTNNEEEAINQACNLLDKLPRMKEASTYEPKQN